MNNQKHTSKRNPDSYSLWLKPENSVENKFQNKIQSLASEYGGPIFKPHITLVSSFLGKEKVLLKITEIVSKKISPFIIYFDNIGYFNKYFCSLFLTVECTSELSAARRLCSTELHLKENKYFPHLSLIYGDYTLDKKQEMISNLGALPDKFLAQSIYLAHNDENNLRWEVIKGFSLNN
jgi:2'-5' RNA ligase